METKSGLSISLFGPVTVVHPRVQPAVRLGQSSQALLAFLLLHQQLCSRDVLMDTFWPDSSPDRARSSLNTAVWRLRQTLEPDGIPHGTYLVSGPGGEIGFNWESGHWLDLHDFRHGIQPLLHHPAVELSEEQIRQAVAALRLYQGALLDGIYADWALREREYMRLLYLDCQ